VDFITQAQKCIRGEYFDIFPPSGHQLAAEEKEVEQGRLGDQHLEKIYRQEESAEARKRQWQPPCALAKPAAHRSTRDRRI